MTVPLERNALWCPSAQADWDKAVAHAVVLGTATEPHSQPLERAIPVTPVFLKLAGSVKPTEVFRFAAQCLGKSCRNYDGGTCRLGEKVARHLPVVLGRLPACTIRTQCRWFAEQGSSVCRRCPAIVTDNALPSKLMRWVADPTTAPQS